MTKSHGADETHQPNLLPVVAGVIVPFRPKQVPVTEVSMENIEVLLVQIGHGEFNRVERKCFI